RISVQDQSVRIAGSAAEIAGIAVQHVQGNIEPRPEGGSLLKLELDAATQADAGLRFLRETPVRDNIGSMLDDWEAEGPVRLDVELGFGLGAASGRPAVAVRATADGPSLNLRHRALRVDDITGLLHYTREAGLQARGLWAPLFG